MMLKNLSQIEAISQIVIHAQDWKTALDQILPIAREMVIFDNLVVYLAASQPGLFGVENLQEVAYARAVGRGRLVGDDISWGENVANRVTSSKQLFVQEPLPIPNEDNRLEKPFVLGYPLLVKNELVGILVLIRFGGPTFTPQEYQLVAILATWIAQLVERKRFEERFSILEAERKQVYLQEDFISTISHELLTPLGFIKGYATTLLRPDANWDDKTRMEFLTIIDEETDRLQELIDNLLDSSRLQRGLLRVDFQWIKLEALIHSVITRAHLRHPEMDFVLNIPIPVAPVQGDPRRLSQVLENLISNAEKYAPGAPVTISLSSANNLALLTVRDEGPGIPARYQPHLFKRFFRNPDQSLNIHGTGLGLYICKQIIEAHHGHITIESTEGKGTTVFIELPCNHDQVVAQGKLNIS
jgi:signal transduction histidine kinase